MTTELWADIPDFPDYQISSLGDIYNSRTRQMMSTSPNNFGHMKISLVHRSGRRVTRSVALLVAESFVEKPNSRCTEVIVLDGDFTNIAARNLAWRSPRFAWKYTHQLKEEQPHYCHNLPVMNVDTGAIYNSIIEAGMTEGLLFEDVWESTYKQKPIYPHGHKFEVLQRV